MTGRAIEAGIKVWGGRIYLAGCNGAIVAGVTHVTHNVRTIMIDCSRGECCGVMTNTAILIGRNMRQQGFRRRESSCMAGGTVIYDTGMIKSSRQESCGLMADATVLESWHMTGGFSGCSGSIVTGGTTISDSCVIELGTGKSGRVMTN